MHDRCAVLRWGCAALGWGRAGGAGWGFGRRAGGLQGRAGPAGLPGCSRGALAPASIRGSMVRSCGEQGRQGRWAKLHGGAAPIFMHSILWVRCSACLPHPALPSTPLSALLPCRLLRLWEGRWAAGCGLGHLRGAGAAHQGGRAGAGPGRWHFFVAAGLWSDRAGPPGRQTPCSVPSALSLFAPPAGGAFVSGPALSHAALAQSPAVSPLALLALTRPSRPPAPLPGGRRVRRSPHPLPRPRRDGGARRRARAPRRPLPAARHHPRHHPRHSAGVARRCSGVPTVLALVAWAV